MGKLVILNRMVREDCTEKRDFERRLGSHVAGCMGEVYSRSGNKGGRGWNRMKKAGSNRKEVGNISSVLEGLVGCCKMDLLLMNWETIRHFFSRIRRFGFHFELLH